MNRPQKELSGISGAHHNALTALDFKLAERIDAIAAEHGA